jgi:hypothetical protein
LCFGNNDGQLAKGTNFSNSCDKDNIKILTQTVTQNKRVFDYQYLRYTSEKYDNKKDGPYFLNAYVERPAPLFMDELC